MVKLNGEALVARGVEEAVLLAVVVGGTTDEHNVSVSVTQTQPQRKGWENLRAHSGEASERLPAEGELVVLLVVLVLMNGVSDMVEVIGDMIEGWTGDKSKTEMEKHNELIKLCLSIIRWKLREGS